MVTKTATKYSASLLSPVAVSVEAIVQSKAIAVGFTAKVNNEETVFEFPAHSELIKELENLFEVDFSGELEFFSASGKSGEIFEIPVSSDQIEADRILLLGLGDGATHSLRQAGAALGRKFRGKAAIVSAICVEADDQLKAFAVSVQLGAYLWNQKTDSTQEIPNFIFTTEEPKAILDAEALASAISLARDLIHTPSNIKTPLWMANQAREVAGENGLEISILSGAGLKEFGGLRAVGNSSPNPGPRFIHLTYTPKGAKNSSRIPHVVLIGKGITFDTGGISLKRPYDTMTAMKSDMAGAAAVLATIGAVAKLGAKVKVSALMMCAENALSGTAQRPSDVIKHYGGKTVEVINTDAEGRLVLADGLAFADINLDTDYVVDIATLTGAISLGLGRQYAALYTRNKALAHTLSEIGEHTGDRVWQMPLIDDYTDGLVSDIADFNHTADKGHYGAGSVTAALFLEQFVGQRQWVHLDIAVTARSESDS